MKEAKLDMWQRSFFTIIIGQTFSLIGSSAVQFALIWWIAIQTDSPIMMGLSGFVAFVPAIFLSPLAGIVADRYNRKYICIIADLFIGIAAAVFALVIWLFQLPMWFALVLLFLRGVGNTFQQPSIQAIIPQLVPQDYLIKANSWGQLIASGSFMLGPVLGAILYAVLPLPLILLTDLVGAILASGLLAIVPIPKIASHEREKKNNFRLEFKEGIDVYRQNNQLFLIIIVETLCMIFFFPLATFYPLMTSSYFNASAWYGSFVEFVYAAGMMISALLLGSIIKVKRKISVAYLGLLGMGITSVLCGILPPKMWGWCLFMILCGFMGGFGNVYSIPLVAYMQEKIEPEKMGRAFSLLSLLSSLAMPIGLLIGSPVAEKIGVNTWFFVSGAFISFIVVTAMIINRKLK